MDKNEARERVRSRYNEGNLKRVIHEKPDDRSEYQQIMEVEGKRFEDRLAEAAMKREEKTGEWPEMKWFNKHRVKFMEGLRERYHDPLRPKPIDPPCKKWREKMGECEPGLRKLLEGTWKANLFNWAKDYHYLSSPSDYCECHSCTAGPKRRYRDAEEWAPMEYPYEE